MTLPISAERVSTPRLTLNVLSVPGSAGDAVVFVHGNVSSSAFWHATMIAIAAEGFRPYALDLRGFGDSDPEPVDASRGVRDYSDDLLALLDHPSFEDLGPAHLVGWSLGGGVVMQAMRDRPAAVRSATLINPVSPYGFGGTTGPDGVLTGPDGVGSGGGAANPEFVAALRAGDRSADSPVSPRTVLRATYVAAGTDLGEEEDAFVQSMLSTRIGEDHYPGDFLLGGLAGRGPRQAGRAQHDRADELPDRRPARDRPEAAHPVDQGRPGHDRLGHVAVRPRAPGGDRRRTRLGRHARPAHGDPDADRAGPLRRLSGGRRRGRRPRPASRQAGGVPRGAARAPARITSAGNPRDPESAALTQDADDDAPQQ
ncbi:hypothetical protein GCM10027612_81780 [Microbispora bryophytorum subsp. camponoti]